MLGVNESVFPAAPAAPVIFTNSDRDELERQNVSFGANWFDQISRERYLGYIACTRAGEKMALAFSRQSADGRTLNPSPFIAQVQRIFPQLAIGKFLAGSDWHAAEHANELVVLLTAIQNSKFKIQNWERLLVLPTVKSLAENLADVARTGRKGKPRASAGGKTLRPGFEIIRQPAGGIRAMSVQVFCPFRPARERTKNL